jgi:quinol monooxygenase YgiN
MSENLRVVARFTAKPASVDVVKRLLQELVQPTRREEGCIAYDLLHNIQDPVDFTFVEEWTSEEALEKHLATNHVGQCRAKIRDHIIGSGDIRTYRIVC